MGRQMKSAHRDTVLALAEVRASGAEIAASGRTRSGHVVLAGLPNAGKSTLLNALVGERLSIVGARPQTTWRRVAGIRTEPGAQMVFLDTPGILAGGRLFHRSMMHETHSAVRDADVAIVVLDGTCSPSDAGRRALLGLLDKLRAPAVLAINKADDRHFDARRGELRHGAIAHCRHVVSARTGRGIETILDFARARLPESPFLHPEDRLATAPTRFFVQELIRERVFELYRQEIPYSVTVRVEEFREDREPLYVSAALYVERRSQKGMVIGKKGRAIRTLGGDARARIEEFLGRRVYLDLWVRVWEGWRRKKAGLVKFGYAVPKDAAPRR